MATILITAFGRDNMVLTAGFSLLAILIAAPPIAGGNETPEHDPGIPPVVWEVVGSSGADGNRDAVSDLKGYTVQFQPGGTLAVTAGCNQSAGTYTAEDGTLEVTLSISTISPCSTAPKFQEESFLKLLDAVTRFEFDHDGFLVLAGDQERLRLRARLTGVLWEWQAFQGADSRTETERPENYTLTFLPGGSLVIQAGCHRASGTYSTDGATIELLVGHATGVTCSRHSMADQFLRDLGEVSSHVFRDGNLYLALWADAGIIEFTARYPESPPATPELGSSRLR